MAEPSRISLLDIVENQDIFHRHVLPFISPKDLCHLEQLSSAYNSAIRLRSDDKNDHFAGWKILCERDFVAIHYIHDKAAAPVYNTAESSFDTMQEQSSWKQSYQSWAFWQHWTCGRARAEHMVEAVTVWSRLKTYFRQQNLENVLQSLSPCPSRDAFSQLPEGCPSSLAAFYSVHGGQAHLHPQSGDDDFFAGMLGCYSCYEDFYSMRLLGTTTLLQTPRHEMTLIGMSLGNPRAFLLVRPAAEEDPEGRIVLMVHHTQTEPLTVGRGGILTYMRNYVERLEAGVYKPAKIVPDSPSTSGICLYPDAGDAVSVCVTRGVEVRASARWLLGAHSYRGGINFGYSIRIRLLETDDDDDRDGDDDALETCQLVGRHWEFTDGNGGVRRVDGEAVIGKQPLFFRGDDGKSGYVDLGPAGQGDRHLDEVFVYQSQSGPVRGTSQEDTHGASVKGTFSFVPGSISNPTGALFHVTVAEFPLSVPSPFY